MGPVFFSIKLCYEEIGVRMGWVSFGDKIEPLVSASMSTPPSLLKEVLIEFKTKF